MPINYGLAPAEAAVGTGGQMGLDILRRGTEVVDDITNMGVNALQGGVGEAYDTIRGTYELGRQPIQQAREGMQSGLGGFLTQGQGASQQQAALSGALGPQAQAQAFQQFESSPGQQFLQERGERAVLRNAAATGGLGGGNVLKALSDYGQGMALQDLENQFARLGQVANRGANVGQTMAGVGAQLAGQESGLAQGLGTFAAGIPLDTASQIANLRQGQAGLQSGFYGQGANIPVNVGGQVATMRQRAGQDIQRNIAGTSSALAELINQQNTGIGGIYGGANADVLNYYSQFLGDDAQARQGLAGQLSQIGAYGSGQYAQPYTAQFNPDYGAQIGQAIQNAGYMYSNWPQQQRSLNEAYNTLPGSEYWT